MDTNLELRAASAGNLTGDSTLTDVDWTPTEVVSYLHVLVPSVSTSDTLLVTADFEDGSNNTLMQIVSKTISAAGHYVIPLVCDDPNVTDLSVILDTTANNSEAVNFGAVVVWISNARKS
jgi:hypothetical protein